MLVALGALLVAAGPGCSMIDSGPLSIFGGRKEHELRPGDRAYAVEFYRDGVRIDRYVAPLAGQITVDDALREARATSQFDRIQVTLLRGKQRMNVDYKNSKNEVDPLSNYHLHHGDRIIVEPDPHTMIDDALKALDGPMAKSLGVP
jgi:hypothetical protein